MERGKIEAITMWAFFEQVLLPRSAVAAGFVENATGARGILLGPIPDTDSSIGAARV